MTPRPRRLSTAAVTSAAAVNAPTMRERTRSPAKIQATVRKKIAATATSVTPTRSSRICTLDRFGGSEGSRGAGAGRGGSCRGGVWLGRDWRGGVDSAVVVWEGVGVSCLGGTGTDVAVEGQASIGTTRGVVTGGWGSQDRGGAGAGVVGVRCTCCAAARARAASKRRRPISATRRSSSVAASVDTARSSAATGCRRSSPHAGHPYGASGVWQAGHRVVSVRSRSAPGQSTVPAYCANGSGAAESPPAGSDIVAPR
ncbi:hypothetical protein KIV56_11890 [Cryobacterium breve]|uniref:Uncharacterized protein n=1 Tax=Cryobacterium breve TaxID=1259258 RepID=A0ABY7N9K5_9MICO|nr:hypothetical protein [Cryobacterium breve]WBM79172.1 hypothetical protein KIV56_11890 [Cryobacterium breve]